MPAITVLVVLGLGLLVPVGLYYAVRSEHDRRETMERRDAEAVARRDRDDPPAHRRDRK